MSERDNKTQPVPFAWEGHTGAVRGFIIANEMLALALEFALFGFLVWWAVSLDVALWLGLIVAVVAVVAVGTVWGLFLSPRVRYRLGPAGTIGAKTLVFALGALALWGVGYPLAGAVFFILGGTNAGVAETVRPRS